MLAAVCFKANVTFLLIHLSLFEGFCVMSMFCFAVFSVFSSFAILLLGKGA